MMTKRKICVVTGTRAEYGLLYWLLKEIQQDNELELQLVVTGMHLSPEFGLTYKTIEIDGFVINEKVEMLLSSDTSVGIAKSIGLGVIGFADALDRLKPDVLVVLGDRYEILAASQAAMVARIPIAHIHGGETTEGVIDEAIRHAITKLAHLHFVSTQVYRRRVIQLGEQPKRVFCFGSPGRDSIRNCVFLNLAELEQELDFQLGTKFFLVTYHPETLQFEQAELAINNLIEALLMYPDYKILITKPNSDTGGRIIGQVIDRYVQENAARIIAVKSLGQQRYLSAMRLCSAVLGNSSSGLFETPLFKKASINIGRRQQGRLRESNVIDCTIEKQSIVLAIEQVLAPEFQVNLKLLEGFDASENISQKIKTVLKEYQLADILQKHFYDL